MYSKKKNFIFVHIPRTGGTTLSYLLKDYSDIKPRIKMNRFNEKYSIDFVSEKGSTKHWPAVKYREYLGNKFYDNCFKFALVRNPWEWYYSCYKFSTFKGRNFSFDEYINMRKPSQSFYLDKSLDKIYRYENYFYSITEILSILNIEMCSIPHYNSRNSSDYADKYSKAGIDKVWRLNKKLIDDFHYQF